MPLVIGIDEAGYGPSLGPLVVAATLWQVDQRIVDGDYWKLLDDCVRRAGRKTDWKLTVDDSKKAFDRDDGIHTLERTVLAFARAAEIEIATLGEFVATVGSDRFALAASPWYGDLEQTLPLDPARSKFEAVSERLRGVMASAGVRLIGLQARVIGERQYNVRVAATRNKAAVLLEQVFSLIDHATRRCGDNDLYVRVDRLGGRSEYRDLLSLSFPDRHVHVTEQTESASRYRLASQRSDWFIGFEVEADQKHLPVALASMAAKYLREALMTRFNAFWQSLLPQLKPTAGYYTDAQRFLRDIEPVLARGGVPVEQFVRAR